MVVYDRSWADSWNNIPPSQASILVQSQHAWYGLKAFLLTQGWTVECSSNGTLASSPGGADHWASFADLVWGAAAHSWIWLKSPANYPSAGNQIWILLDFPTANAYEFTCSFCSGAPTGVFSTSSSGTKTNANTFTNKQFKRVVLTNLKWHVTATPQGDFLFFLSHDGTGYALFALGVVATNNRLEANEGYSALEICSFLDSGLGALSGIPLTQPTNVQGHWFDGAANAQTVVAQLWLQSQGVVALNQFTSVGDRRPGALNGTYPDPPVFIFSLNPVAYRGILIDVRGAPQGTGVLQTTVHPDTGPVQSAIVGIWHVPATVRPVF